MKKSVLIIVLSVIASFAFQDISAQYSSKEVKESFNTKPPKEIRKQAKEYEKQGYMQAVGALSIERQLTNAQMKAMETEEDGTPKYLQANAKATGETQIAAKLQASEMAKLDLAGQIQTNVAALIENNIANSGINTEEANSVTKTVAASKSIISQELSMVIPVVEMYRSIEKNMEANVIIAYNRGMATQKAKEVIRKSLEEETNIMQDKLDKLMNF